MPPPTTTTTTITSSSSSSSRPSPLAISTASVQRLLKEEWTYRAELASQEARLRTLQQQHEVVVEGGGGRRGEEEEGGGDEEDDGNRAWRVGQEKQAIAETKAVFAPLREKLLAAAGNLEQLLKSRGAEQFDKGEVDTANALVAKAKDG